MLKSYGFLVDYNEVYLTLKKLLMFRLYNYNYTEKINIYKLICRTSKYVISQVVLLLVFQINSAKMSNFIR